MRTCNLPVAASAPVRLLPRTSFKLGGLCWDGKVIGPDTVAIKMIINLLLATSREKVFNPLRHGNSPLLHATTTLRKHSQRQVCACMMSTREVGIYDVMSATSLFVTARQAQTLSCDLARLFAGPCSGKGDERDLGGDDNI